jgi:CAAX protease family protein
MHCTLVVCSCQTLTVPAPRPDRPRPLPSARDRLLALAGLAAGFGWPFLLAGRTHSIADVHQDLITVVAEWTVVGALAAVAFGVQRWRFVDFNVRGFTRRDLGAMGLALVATYLLVGLVSRFVALQTSSLDVARLGEVPLTVRIGLVLTAGICEEFIYRGFGIEEIASLTGSWPVGALVSWAAFSLGHIDRYGWSPGLLIPAIAGGALTLLYLWRRSLPACILMHALIDGGSLLLAPMLMRPPGH